VCIAPTVGHNTAQNRPDNFPSYSPDNHHCFDDVYLKEGEYRIMQYNRRIGWPHQSSTSLTAIFGWTLVCHSLEFILCSSCNFWG